MNYSGQVGQKVEPSDPGRVNLSWLTEQMEAAVADVRAAWQAFRDGPALGLAVQVITPNTPDHSTDRLNRMADLIPELQGLADEIRGRI